MASYNAMSFKKTTRKDDMVSLAYLLIFMVQGFISFCDGTMPDDSNEKNFHIRRCKQMLSIDKFCETARSKLLRPFISEIEHIGFNQQPDYEGLKLILAAIILT